MLPLAKLAATLDVLVGQCLRRARLGGLNPNMPGAMGVEPSADFAHVATNLGAELTGRGGVLLGDK